MRQMPALRPCTLSGTRLPRNGLVRIPTDTSRPSGQMTFRKEGTLLRAYVYGDASRAQIRLVVADSADTVPPGSAEHREVTRWIPLEWVGWRAITWDLEADTLGSGTGNGSLEGQLRFDGIELAYVKGTSKPATTVYVDHLELIDRTVTAVENERSRDSGALHAPSEFPESIQPVNAACV